MRGLKVHLCCIALLASLALVPSAGAQVSVGINIGGGPPPSCPYGYYNYAPYSCAPSGFWGPNYFYNGIFLGVGPWYHWGYRNGWGNHRFVPNGGGGYIGRGGPGYYGGRPGYGHGGPRPGYRPGGPGPRPGGPGGRPGGGGGHHGGGGRGPGGHR